MGSLMRTPFMIGSGVVLLLVILMVIFGVAPAMRANNQKFKTLETRAEELTRAAQQGVKNDQWIKQEQERQKQLQEQIEAVKAGLAETDSVLERWFDDPSAEGAAVKGPLEYGRWRHVYKSKMDELARRLEKNVDKVMNASPLVVAQLPDKWLPPAQFHPLEKQYWVQEGVVNAVVEFKKGGTALPIFDTFRFLKAPERFVHPSHKTLFTTYPFELQVAMSSLNLAEFQRKLLESPLRIEITSVTVQLRWPQAGDMATPVRAAPGAGAPGGAAVPGGAVGMPPGGAWGGAPGMPGGPAMGPDMMWPTPGAGAPGQAGPAAVKEEEAVKKSAEELVAVTIRGYVPDYKQPEKKEAAPAAPGAPPAGAPPGGAAVAPPAGAAPAAPALPGAPMAPALPGAGAR